MNNIDTPCRVDLPVVEIDLQEADKVAGGWSWGGAFFVGGCASEFGPVGAAIGFLAGGLFG